MLLDFTLFNMIVPNSVELSLIIVFLENNPGVELLQAFYFLPLLVLSQFRENYQWSPPSSFMSQDHLPLYSLDATTILKKT